MNRGRDHYAVTEHRKVINEAMNRRRIARRSGRSDSIRTTRSLMIISQLGSPLSITRSPL